MNKNVVSLHSHRAAAQDEGLIPINEDSVTIHAMLGAANLTRNQLSQMKPGQMIQLDAKVGDSLTIMVGSRFVARANVVVIGETQLGMSITEILVAETSADTETKS